MILSGLIDIGVVGFGVKIWFWREGRFWFSAVQEEGDTSIEMLNVRRVGLGRQCI